MKLLRQKYQTPVGCFKKILLAEEKSLRLVLTGQCNLACEFCVYKTKNFYSPEIHSPNFIEMRPTAALKKVLRVMKKSLNFNIVQLTGGEPTLAKNILEIARLAKNTGFKINLCSNLIIIKPLLQLLKNGLLNELTFSYLPLDSAGQRKKLPYYKRPSQARVKKIKENALYLKSHSPNLTVKTNIIVSPFTDTDDFVKFVRWCWKNGIVPRAQRDRSANHISGSTKKMLNLLKSLGVKPKKVILRIPGNTEICEFKNPAGKIIYVKVFNKNFRLDKICKFCDKAIKNKCHKSLSNIRIYNTQQGPRMCFCTEHNKDFAHLKIEQFLKSEVLTEIRGYKKNKLSYFTKFCTNITSNKRNPLAVAKRVLLMPAAPLARLFNFEEKRGRNKRVEIVGYASASAQAR